VGTEGDAESYPDQIRAEVRTFLSRFVDDPAHLDGPGLITGGLLDSMVAVQMIALIESRFGIEVDNDDLEIEHFDSLDNVVAFVLRKVGR
jgi:acyl carrier protein